MWFSWSGLAKLALQFWSGIAANTDEQKPLAPEQKTLLTDVLSTNTEVEERGGYTEGAQAFLSEGFRLGLFYKEERVSLCGERWFWIHLRDDDITMKADAKSVRRVVEFAYRYAVEPDFGVHLVILRSPTRTKDLKAFDAGEVNHALWDTGRFGNDPETTLADWLESQGESPIFPDLPAEYWMSPFPVSGESPSAGDNY